MHRMDPTTPIEETMGEVKKLKEEGKIKYVGLSECGPSDIRRAHAVVPISAIQMEWSLQTRDLEERIIPVARELGIGIVAYSPLGRGLLTNTLSKETLSEKDWRNSNPRFSGDNLDKNKSAAEKLAAIAEKKGCTAGQLALGWVHARGKDVFPIPGTTKPKRITENAGAFGVSLSLSESDLKEMEAAVPEAVGARYGGAFEALNHNNRE
mmetsp:Transcript_34018/g.53017  ORF Transcript_34018/g.53017 Transcript_34018/m.53017 type:complete len:209 (-) Transcript_34018:242-868(-)